MCGIFILAGCANDPLGVVTPPAVSSSTTSAIGSVQAIQIFPTPSVISQASAVSANGTVITLQTGSTTGSYTSQAVQLFPNGGSTATQQFTLSWTPQAPYLKELPKKSESGYDKDAAISNMDMTSGALLMHFNSDSTNANEAYMDALSGAQVATCTSCPTTTTGTFNGALQFDGASNLLSVQKTSSVSGVTDFSISTWVKANSPTALDGVPFQQWDQNNGDAGSFRFVIGKDSEANTNKGDIAFITTGGSKGTSNSVNLRLVASSSSIPTTLNDGNWHHLVAVRSTDAKGKSTGALYLDGTALSLNSSSSITGANAPDLLVGKPMTIGANFSSGGSKNTNEYFNGAIDELAMFSRALTASEASKLYQRGSLKVKLQLQVLNCPANSQTCTATGFMGPDGTNQTFYSELLNNTNLPPALTIALSGANPTNNPYVQYQVSLESGNAKLSPAFDTSAIRITPIQGGSDSVVAFPSFSQ